MPQASLPCLSNMLSPCLVIYNMDFPSLTYLQSLLSYPAVIPLWYRPQGFASCSQFSCKLQTEEFFAGFLSCWLTAVVQDWGPGPDLRERVAEVASLNNVCLLIM